MGERRTIGGRLLLLLYIAPAVEEQQKINPTKPKKAKRTKFDKLLLSPFFFWLSVIVSIAVVYLLIYLTPPNGFPVRIGALAMIAGVFFESKRLMEGWKPLLHSWLRAFAMSILAFIPGKRERVYNPENHLMFWPYVLIGYFIFDYIAFHKEKVIPKLTEGISLLQSVAIAYWVVAHDLINLNRPILLLFVLLPLMFSLFVMFHAFTYTPLSTINRLVLSIGGSIIMMLFAAENIWRVHSNEEIEMSMSLMHGLFIALQYFLLGVSAIYIVTNFIMLWSFIPGTDRLEFLDTTEEVKQAHIKRYSDQQVDRIHSLICVLFGVIAFSFNHMLQLVPAHVAIWTVFVLFPFVLPLYDAMRGQKPTVN